MTNKASRTRRRTSERDPWWDGRHVAIRPDVPGVKLDVGDLVLARTDEERDQVNVGIDRYATEVARSKSDDELADWLAED
jgi:hypothetical protein